MPSKFGQQGHFVSKKRNQKHIQVSKSVVNVTLYTLLNETYTKAESALVVIKFENVRQWFSFSAFRKMIFLLQKLPLKCVYALSFILYQFPSPIKI